MIESSAEAYHVVSQKNGRETVYLVLDRDGEPMHLGVFLEKQSAENYCSRLIAREPVPDPSKRIVESTRQKSQCSNCGKMFNSIWMTRHKRDGKCVRETDR